MRADVIDDTHEIGGVQIPELYGYQQLSALDQCIRLLRL
jgi:hypothetical protein